MSAALQGCPNPSSLRDWRLVPAGSYDGLRVLAWDGNILYASRGYEVLQSQRDQDLWEWKTVAGYRPDRWRRTIAGSRVLSRLVRNGFHALCSTSSGHLIAAVPGGIVTLDPGEKEFRLSHRVTRGTRPLHLCVTPDDVIFWGEYFDNPSRQEVHIYASADRGASWYVAHTFPAGSARHVHNIVYDRWRDCLWIATGDDGKECQILRASSTLDQITPVLSGCQQTRTASLIPTAEGLFFSTDTPFEKNHVYRLGDSGNLRSIADLNSSSIFGCSVGQTLFFSTMVEPSKVNGDRSACLFGGQPGGPPWRMLSSWEKDNWPGIFQYGNVILPDGRNDTNLLALTTIAVKGADVTTHMWRVKDGE